MDKIKIAQIGVGHAHADGKMAALRGSKDFEVVGVVEPDPELRHAAQGRSPYRDLPWLTQEQLLNTSGLKAVAVETRVADSLATAELCIDAGLHIHLDKPAGTSLPHFKRILDSAERQHLLVQMGYMYRYSPAVILMRDFLKRGWLGEPFEVHTVMSKVVSPSKRGLLATFAGGMMFELGCHIMDLVIGVLGKPESVTPYHQHAANIDDKLQDNMLAVLSYPRALATVKSSAMEVEGFSRRQFTVCGTEGTFHIQPLDAPDVRIALSEARDGYSRKYQTVQFGSYDRYVGDAADMAKIIRGEKDTDFSYEHDYAVQTAILQASAMPLDT